jgi:hypothetical protein
MKWGFEMLFRTIAAAKSKLYAASLTMACAMVAMLLTGCASKEQRAAMETQFDKTHRQPVVAEMNEVAKHVTAEHLAACKARIEAAETLFGLKWRLTGPLLPHAGSTCAATPGFLFAEEGVKRVAYLARAEPYGSFSVAKSTLTGCTMELRGGKVEVKYPAPTSVQQNGAHSLCARL